MDGRPDFVCRIKNKTEKAEHLFLQGVDPRAAGRFGLSLMD